MTDQVKPAQLRSTLLGKIVGWLRAGYPQGIPHADYVAVFAVLHRHLTDYEVVAIAEKMAVSNPDGMITHADIEAAIGRFVKEQPNDRDIARVASRLAAGGWPLAALSADSD
ncbi:DUF3349 domain-containing protein [Nocardia sp. NPDC049190]|uniref:DUF3349 domain-containing protein n=1 Tax=Nocardia sp. NPDC049190 TaxID=3155650 RepID=UPI0033C56F1F